MIPRFFSSLYSLPVLVRQKVGFLFFSRIILQMGIVLLSTLIVSSFIAYYSEGLFPILLLFQAVFLFFGHMLAMPIVKKISVKKALILWMSIAGILLFLSQFSTYFFLKFSIWIFVLGFFLWHALVFFALYIEQIFSPEEAEHAIPLIEAGEPLGGIFAGIIAALGAFFIPPSLLEIIAGGLLLLSAGIVFMSAIFIEDVQLWHTHEEKTNKNHQYFWDEIIDFCIVGFNNPLLKKLFWAGFIQAIIFVIIEYQYLLAAAALVPAHSASSVQEEIALQLTHGLGVFHVVVFSVLFLVQMLGAHHIQKTLGVIKSLWIQPFLLSLNALFMIIFTFIPLGMLGKGVYEISGGIYKNAIASCFYAFKSAIRDQAREFLEGIARPLGMILGALIVIVSASMIEKNILLHFLGMLVIGLAVVFLFLMRKAPQDYSRMAERNITLPHFPEEKFDAIEILSQKGHKNACLALVDVIKNEAEPLFIRISALNALTHHYDMNIFSDILAILENNTEEELKIHALELLRQYAQKNNNFEKYPFSRQRIIGILQELFENSTSKKMKMKLIQILSLLQYSEMMPFLQKNISHHNTDIAFCSILACGSFQDISIAPLILPFLENKNSYIRSASIIALWQFPRYRQILFSAVILMIKSEDIDMQMSGIYTVGELNITSEYSRIKKILAETNNMHIKKHATIALAKMKDKTQIPNIASLLFHKDEEIATSTKKLIQSPGLRFAFETQLMSFIWQKALHEIRNIAKTHGHIPLSHLKKEIIQKLSFLYTAIGAEKMVARLKYYQ